MSMGNSEGMNIFTIGFTKKPAKRFFDMLRASGARRIVDVRLNNVSQLAGFAKKNDLAYFAKEICGMDYVHVPDLAPTPDLLRDYRQRKIGWEEYEVQFLALMRDRRVQITVASDLLDAGCLLCSEDQPDHCHRRLVAEYLKQHWAGVEIVHLGHRTE